MKNRCFSIKKLLCSTLRQNNVFRIILHLKSDSLRWFWTENSQKPAKTPRVVTRSPTDDNLLATKSQRRPLGHGAWKATLLVLQAEQGRAVDVRVVAVDKRQQDDKVGLRVERVRIVCLVQVAEPRVSVDAGRQHQLTFFRRLHLAVHVFQTAADGCEKTSGNMRCVLSLILPSTNHPLDLRS